jgi:hypothetical protein
MEYDKIVSETIENSEKQKQEAEISKIKAIVTKILEKIDKLKERKVDLEKELKVLTGDLDDLKAGRLDKIKERQEKDPDHNGYTIIIVREIEKEYQPLYPWRSPWVVEWREPYHQPISISGLTNGITTVDCTAINNLYQGVQGQFTSTGTMFQNFCGGTYDINGHIINL